MKPLRSRVRLVHAGGTVKEVELVGFEKARGGLAMLSWPLAGFLHVRLRDGRLLELGGDDAPMQRQWRVDPEDLRRLREAFTTWADDERKDGAA